MTLSTHSSLVVNQAGASAALDLPVGLSEHIVTVTQKEGEALYDLAHRVRHAIDILRAQERALATAVFIARPDFDQHDVPATADLVRAVVAEMVNHGEGNVHLHAVTRDPRARYALMALADAVGEQVRGTGVHVHTRTVGVSGTVRIDDVRRRAAG